MDNVIKPAVSPEAIEDFKTCTDGMFKKNGPASNMLSAAHANKLKMRHWVTFTGARYPLITRSTVYKPKFLLAVPGYDQRGITVDMAAKRRKLR